MKLCGPTIGASFVATGMLQPLLSVPCTNTYQLLAKRQNDIVMRHHQYATLDGLAQMAFR